MLKQPAVVGGNRLAMTALIVGGIAIGTSPILVRLSELGPYATAFWRVALAFLPLFVVRRVQDAVPADATPSGLYDYILLALPGLFIAADLIAWHVALVMTSVANATLLANMAPIFVTLGAWILFGARVTPRFLIGLAAALVGVVVLKGGIGGFVGGQSMGDFIAMLAAVFYAGYILAIGRLRSRFSTLTIMMWSSVVGSILLLPLTFLMESQVLPYTLVGWLVVIGLGFFAHAGGQGLIAYALAYLPASFSSLTLLLQPVVAAILAWIVLSEPLGLMQGVGGVIVIAGILIARRG